jgi:hypothetical protein
MTDITSLVEFVPRTTQQKHNQATTVADSELEEQPKKKKAMKN